MESPERVRTDCCGLGRERGRRRERRTLSAVGYSLFALFCVQPMAVGLSVIPRSSRNAPRLAAHVDHDRCAARDDSLAPTSAGRRQALASLASLALLLPVSCIATSSDALEQLSLGEGQWQPLDRSQLGGASTTNKVSASFCTYAARFLIQYDDGVRQWWKGTEQRYSLLDNDQRQAKLDQAFGALARSIASGVERAMAGSSTKAEAYGRLWDLFMDKYGTQVDARRQIALLFAMLPDDEQPVSRLEQQGKGSSSSTLSSLTTPLTDNSQSALSLENLTALLPSEYQAVKESNDACFTVHPPVDLYEIGIDEEFGQTATATAFGPLATQPLIRDRPRYTPDIYGLFALSGATGCALTHSVVIPLDVVKTRNQVDPKQYSNFVGSAVRIAKDEGVRGLLYVRTACRGATSYDFLTLVHSLGAEATIAGYFWYGLSVYPCYTFFKRALTMGPLLPVEYATVHGNELALLAGALASVVASLGLTPLEAARIRVVADPDKYRPLGLTGTIKVIADEGETAMKSLYAGLPSLLTRQVIFGSVKFLAFERACEFIFSLAPVLRDETWTSLTVSLVAGGFAGALSSVVSQPADSVLTYVAQNSEGSSIGLGVIKGCQVMIQKEGVGSLFRGLGSRCIWAGSIIAGQFLLYDVFRTYFGVNTDDLSQVYQVVFPS